MINPLIPAVSPLTSKSIRQSKILSLTGLGQGRSQRVNLDYVLFCWLFLVIFNIIIITTTEQVVQAQCSLDELAFVTVFCLVLFFSSLLFFFFFFFFGQLFWFALA